MWFIKKKNSKFRIENFLLDKFIFLREIYTYIFMEKSGFLNSNVLTNVGYVVYNKIIIFETKI